MSRGAPRLASRFKLQYRQTRLTTSFLPTILSFEMYAIIRSKILAGMTGGPELKEDLYARADLPLFGSRRVSLRRPDEGPPLFFRQLPEKGEAPREGVAFCAHRAVCQRTPFK